jgi:hypothetical protein
VLWQYISYLFILDASALINDGTSHNSYIIYVFIITNIGLTILQFVWMWEIVTTATKILTSSDSTLSISRGDKKDDKIRDKKKD